MSPRIEACVDGLTVAEAAVAGGAARLELCDNLTDGGTTPSHGMLSYLLDTLDVPVFPIIRPRGGSFHYSREECRVMARDVAHAAALGASGVVVGALTADGDIDIEALLEIALHRDDLELTFHRAFDQVRDPEGALDTLINNGFDRVLTSGGAPTAWQGRDVIARLVRQAGDRITIMAGGGVRPDTVRDLVTATGVAEIHASLRGDVSRIQALATALG